MKRLIGSIALWLLLLAGPAHAQESERMRYTRDSAEAEKQKRQAQRAVIVADRYLQWAEERTEQAVSVEAHQAAREAEDESRRHMRRARVTLHKATQRLVDTALAKKQAESRALDSVAQAQRDAIQQQHNYAVKLRAKAKPRPVAPPAVVVVVRDTIVIAAAVPECRWSAYIPIGKGVKLCYGEK